MSTTWAITLVDLASNLNKATGDFNFSYKSESNEIKYHCPTGELAREARRSNGDGTGRAAFGDGSNQRRAPLPILNQFKVHLLQSTAFNAMQIEN
jgi:hypothetical protein